MKWIIKIWDKENKNIVKVILIDFSNLDNRNWINKVEKNNSKIDFIR